MQAESSYEPTSVRQAISLASEADCRFVEG